MSDKQQGEIVANPVAYDQLLSYLLHAGEALLGETHGVFDRLAQEMALVTHGQVQLVLSQENSEQSPPPQSRFRFLVYFKNRFYGMLIIAPDPANPVSPATPVETATMLAQACGWLFYTIEVTALLPELRQSYTKAYRARTSLKERERDILALMCQGYTTEKTATMLQIAPAPCTSTGSIFTRSSARIPYMIPSLLHLPLACFIPLTICILVSCPLRSELLHV